MNCAKTVLYLFVLSALWPQATWSADSEHDHHDERAAVTAHDENAGHGDEQRGGENLVVLTDAAQKAADIRVEVIASQPVATIVTAAGEVRFNSYRTSKVGPRLAAQIIERFAKLGDRVTVGQRLASVSSVDMAAAQGQLLVAAREWARVQKLGEQTASEKRFVEAKIGLQQARAKLLSYGMPEAQLKTLLEKDDSALATGTFDLLAPRAGTIVADEFVDGEFVEPGRVLFEVSDETQLWVESRMAPAQAAGIGVGAKADVTTPDGSHHMGNVVQVLRRVDEATRTVGLRIAVNNENGTLQPGLFVKTDIAAATKAGALVLPLDAVVRTPDGDWGVYLETSPGKFALAEVKVQREWEGQAVVEGFAPGSRVVTRGAFFIQSEQAKSGFDPHNH